MTGVGNGRAPEDADDLGDVALMPGLVNAHTHLELAGWPAWFRRRRRWTSGCRRCCGCAARARRAASRRCVAAMARAAIEMRATGTVLAGDISNTLLVAARARRSRHRRRRVSRAARVQRRRSGPARARGLGARGPRRAVDAPNLTFGVVAHAPYSVSPALFAEIARSADATPLSIHLGESPEEIEFLRTGRGPIRATLEALGVWTGTWRVPACDPGDLHRRPRLPAAGRARRPWRAPHGRRPWSGCGARAPCW